MVMVLSTRAFVKGTKKSAPKDTKLGYKDGTILVKHERYNQ